MTTNSWPTAGQGAHDLKSPAHPWRRLMGIFYEGVILFGVLWLANYIFSTLTTYKAETGSIRLVFQGFQVLVLGAYFVGFWSRGRRTLPMKTLDLQLVDSQGQLVTEGRALLRYLAALAMFLSALALYKVHPIAVVAVLIPTSWSLLDGKRRALYDIVAGTELVTQSPNTKADKPPVEAIDRSSP